MAIKLILAISVLFVLITGCNLNKPNDQYSTELSKEFKDYWYDGTAEISSYDLSQARYGEIREGKSVLIYVTEAFSKKNHTKADNPTKEDPSVLKLNFTKNFVTGIYPYSIMTSLFSPLIDEEHAMKISTSTQEWCGHTYMEMIKKKDFDISVMSYFEGERNQNQHIPITHLEDEFWTTIRIDPKKLPLGELSVIPSFSYLRLTHQETKSYKCTTNLERAEDKSVYSINYDELNRAVKIEFEAKFPHKILGWEESYPCVGCETKEFITSSATLSNTIKTDYWNENSKSDTLSRSKLGIN